jgi:thiol-disulfide isomerase/thioredoxin
MVFERGNLPPASKVRTDTAAKGLTMKLRSLRLLLCISFALRLSALPQPAPESPAGTWVGAAAVNGKQVPFRLELRGTGQNIQGVLVNGRERSASSSGSFSNQHLVLHFDYYANTLDATLSDGTLNGTFGGHLPDVSITAHLNAKTPAPSAGAPNISGDWSVAVQGPKGEHAWKLRVRQTGASVVTVIERIDGDTGNLYGQWHDGKFAVSHFTAAGPSYAELLPQPGGTLQLVTFAHGGGLLTLPAHRTQAGVTGKQEAADDPLQHTLLKNPKQPLAFSFPDLNGRQVSNTDPEFRGKAVIVSIGGSWCPNCQDEAPFLETLYRRFHGQGLEIVEVSFEEESQLKDPARLKAVIHRYGITYQVLLAGTPDQLNEKFPSVTNLNCWPTTFFIGRNGTVMAIHTGYSGPATAQDNDKLRSETVALVQGLLSRNSSGQP